MKVKIFFPILLSIFIIMTATKISIAQTDYPTKPIEITYSYSAGSFGDIVARTLAQEAKKNLGQEIIVINKVGGSGTVGINHVGSAKPDGYTLGTTPSAPFTIVPLILKLSFDPIEVVTPIVSFAILTNGIVVTPDSPFKSLNDLLQYAKQNPGKVSCGTAGFGTRAHLVIMPILAQEGIKMNLVSFAGDMPGLTALLGGHVTVYVTSMASAYPHIKDGKLRLLAITEEERMDAFPEVPCTRELGYPIALPSVFILYGPKNLPEHIVKKLEDLFYKAAQSAAVTKLTTDNVSYQKKKMFGKEIANFFRSQRAEASAIIQKLDLEKK